jgi:hypothetical protein
MQTPTLVSNSLLPKLNNNYSKNSKINSITKNLSKLETKVYSEINTIKSKYKTYKFIARSSQILSIVTSSILFTHYLSNNILISENINNIIIISISSLQLLNTISYIIIQPSQKSTIHEEILDGLISLQQQIEISTLNKKDHNLENLVTFETCLYKLQKKLESP